MQIPNPPTFPTSNNATQPAPEPPLTIATLPGRFGLGFPTVDENTTPAETITLPLEAALRQQFSDDRYLLSYASPMDCRLKKGSERQIRVECRYLLIDVDFKNADLSPEWRSSVSHWVGTLGGELGEWTAHYHTPHGWRLLYVFRQAVPPEVLESEHSRLCQALQDAGVQTDAATKDWTRLMRAPYATKEDGTKTWEVVDPAVQIRPGRRIEPSTPIPVAAGPTPHNGPIPTPAGRARADQGSYDMPDPIEFLTEVIENFNGKWPRTGRDGARFRNSLRRIESDLNGLAANDLAKQQLCANIRIAYEQQPFIQNRNSSIHQVVWWIVNQQRRIQSKDLQEGAPIEARFVTPLEAFRWIAPSLFAMDQDPQVSAPDQSERASTWYEHGWLEVENACNRINQETEDNVAEMEIRAEQLVRDANRIQNASENFSDGEPNLEALRFFFRGFFVHNSLQVHGDPDFLTSWEESDEALLELLAFVRMRAVLVLSKVEMTVLTARGCYSQIHHTRDGLNKAIQMAGNPLGLRLFSVNPETGVIRWLDGKELETKYAVPVSKQEYFFADSTNPAKRSSIVHTGTDDIVTVYNPASWWNSAVVENPRFSPIVHEWLYNLAGQNSQTFFRLVAWLAHFMDQTLYLPALVLGPFSRTGKSLLISALRDMYNENSTARDILAEIGMSSTRRAGANIQVAQPLTVSEEGLLSIASSGRMSTRQQLAKEISTRLKEFITQREQRVRLLYQQRESVLKAVPRVVIASNDGDDAETLITSGGLEAGAAIDAQQNRVLYVECVEESVGWMTKHSALAQKEGWAITNHLHYSRDNRDLIREIPTAYTIARHIAWLNRYRMRGAPINIGDWGNYKTVVPYEAIVRDKTDMLLSLTPTQSAGVIARSGSPDRQEYLDQIVILLRQTLTDRSNAVAPRAEMPHGTAERSGGVYWCPDVDGFVINVGIAREKMQMLRQFSRTGNRAAADKLTKWGFPQLERKHRRDLAPSEPEEKPLRVKWGGGVGNRNLHPYSNRIIPRAVMIEHLHYSEQFDVLTMLEHIGML